jgi:AraC-like DNA-binding protein
LQPVRAERLVVSLITGSPGDVLASFISRCHATALSASQSADAGTAFQDLQGLGLDIPTIDEPGGRLLLNHALVRVCLQAASTFKRSADIQEITSSLFDLVGARDHSALVGAYRRALHAIDDSGTASGVGDARIANALQVIEREHANTDLRLDDIAKRVRLSKWHLNRLMMRHTGYGFLHHLREIRLHHARRLLVDTTLTIKEIAFDIGYKYVNELDRHFMAKHGLTPSTYRQRSLVAENTRLAMVASSRSPVKSDETRSAFPRG